jgi:hypothetical protein
MPTGAGRVTDPGARLGIYVDVENVHKSIAELRWGKQEAKQHHPALDPPALVKELDELVRDRELGNWTTADVLLFTGKPPARGSAWLWYEPLRHIWRSTRRVEVHDWQVGWKTNCAGKLVWKQDATDVNLAVTAVLDAAARKYSAILIVSGDGDFDPAVKRCKQLLGASKVLTVGLAGRAAAGRDFVLDRPRAIRADMWARMSTVSRGYLELYGLESEGNQAAIADFISYISASDVHEAHLALVRAFFDAWWWWGNLADYEFCGQLVAGWDGAVTKLARSSRHRQRAEEHRVLLDALVRFHARYPVGEPAQKLGAAPWPEVAETLHTIRSELGLVGGRGAPWRTDPAERHVAALLEIYLAECDRFGAIGSGSPTARHRAAADHYLAATRLFNTNDERWNLAWVRAEWAALDQEHRAWTLALARCDKADDAARAVAAAEEHPDHELFATTARIGAGVLLARPGGRHGSRSADRTAGYREVGRALRHGFAFQVRPAHHPDPYTQSFYRDLRRWAADTVFAGHGDDGVDGARRVISGWLGLWSPVRPGLSDDQLRRLVERARTDEDRQDLLSPRPPCDDDLHLARHDFVGATRGIVERLEEAGGLARCSPRRADASTPAPPPAPGRRS